MQSADEMLMELGFGKLEAGTVIAKVVPAADLAAKLKADEPKRESFLGSLIKRVTTRSTQPVVPSAKHSPIRVAGVDDVLVRFGKCCAPVPGDEIIGFITRGRGITVHAQNCQKGLDSDPGRRIDVEWEEGARVPRTVSVKIITTDRKGLLAEMSQVFTEMGINISQANCRTSDDNRAVNTFDVAVTDSTQLRRAMRRIEALVGVVAVERLGGH